MPDADPPPPRIDTKNKLMQALEHLHPEGFEGLDPARPTPSDYAGYVASLLPGHEPYSEAELLEALAAWEAAREARRIARERAALVLTRAQFAEMLIRRGIQAQVEAAIAAEPDLTERAVLQAWYAHAPTVRRDAPKVETLRAALGIEPSVADEWFRVALTYE